MIITKDEMIKLVQGLTPKIFNNEKQFQFEFALALKDYFDKANRKCQIHFEYRSESGNHYYDLVLEENGEFCPIELKHKALAHKAQDLGRYDFLKDVERIECFKKDNPNKKNENGFAIILTEDKAYWEKDGANFNYREFAIKDGSNVKAGAKNWVTKTKLNFSQLKAKYGFRAGAINTKDYGVEWKNYCSNYRFLLFEIK